MKIYTKQGDKGSTSLIGGTKIEKDSIRVEAYGTIDELNSYIGLCVNYLEKDEDKEVLKKINEFIVPGTSICSANLHIARTVCRRAERRILTLSREDRINPILLKYVNRLSDLLYILARYSEEEIIPVKF